jgi:hypothetical protein
MSVTDWKLPNSAITSEVESGDDGYDEIAWAYPGRAKASDNSRAYSVAIVGNAVSGYLRCTDFGFTSADIPAGSVINGIEVLIERSRSVTAPVTDPANEKVFDRRVYLRSSEGQVGYNRANEDLWNLTTDEEITYGGSGDLWDAGLEYDDIVGNSDFGVDLQALLEWYDATILSARVDVVKIRVYYTAVPSKYWLPHRQIRSDAAADEVRVWVDGVEKTSSISSINYEEGWFILDYDPGEDAVVEATFQVQWICLVKNIDPGIDPSYRIRSADMRAAPVITLEEVE